MFLKELFDNPVGFFRKKRSFIQGFLWMLAAFAVLVVLNQLMIELGVVQFKPGVGPLETIAINFVTLLGGYFVITAVCSIPFRAIGGNARDFFMIATYSLIPVMFLWIPHILPQAIIVAMSAVIMTRGIAIRTKSSDRKAFLVTLCFMVLVVAFSLLAKNFILLFGDFNILPL